MPWEAGSGALKRGAGGDDEEGRREPETEEEMSRVGEAATVAEMSKGVVVEAIHGLRTRPFRKRLAVELLDSTSRSEWGRGLGGPAMMDHSDPRPVSTEWTRGDKKREGRGEREDQRDQRDQRPETRVGSR